MAHQQQFQFFQSISKHYPHSFSQGKVAEIGSLDINGSVRQCFSAKDYTGFDIAEGKGVDVVQNGELISSPTAFYDTVISSECFEHNPFWVETFANMLRMTKHGGLIILSCATTGRQEHGTTRVTPGDSPLTTHAGWNYYKNLDANDFLETFNMLAWFDAFHFLMCPQTFDLYFYGLRSNKEGGTNSGEFTKTASEIEAELYLLNSTIRIGYWTKKHGWCPR